MVQIYCDNYPNMEHQIKLQLCDEKLNVLKSDSILGNKYHNGIIQVVDWNNDGLEDLKFNILNPTSSVAHCHYDEVVFTVNSDNKFSEIFNLTLDERACTAISEFKGEMTQRAYFFVDGQTIEVIQRRYSFPCESFKFEGAITNAQLLSTIKFQLKWDVSKNRFEAPEI